MGLSRRAPNRAANFGRSGESNFVYIVMLHQRFARRAVAGDNVDHASRQPNFVAQFRECQRGQRSVLRRFQYHRVSRGQRGSNFPCQH